MTVKDYFTRATLHDGSPVIIRAIKPEDKSKIENALQQLSSESVYLRFFYSKQKFSERELRFLTEVDFENHAAIGVGLVEGDEIIPIGIGRYIVDESDHTRAEIAFTVADDFQGIGVGSLLLKHLIIVARANGIETFYATTIPGNQKMLRVFSRSQLPMQSQTIDGVVEVTLSLETTE